LSDNLAASLSVVVDSYGPSGSSLVDSYEMEYASRVLDHGRSVAVDSCAVE